MCIEFQKLLELTIVREEAGTKYYNLNNFLNTLDEIDEENIKMEDMIITPFYISDLGILELYDFELNFRLVKQDNQENFMLEKTGKQNIGDIPSEIRKKLENCYIEVVKPNKSLSIFKLREYMLYVKNSKEINERVIQALEEYDTNRLYFEVF